MATCIECFIGGSTNNNDNNDNDINNNTNNDEDKNNNDLLAGFQVAGTIWCARRIQ